MTHPPEDIDGKPYAVGQIILVATSCGRAPAIERRVVLRLEPTVRVCPPGEPKRAANLVYPSRHYILS